MTIKDIIDQRLPSHLENMALLQPEATQVVEAYRDGLLSGDETTLYMIAYLLHMTNTLWKQVYEK